VIGTICFVIALVLVYQGALASGEAEVVLNVIFFGVIFVMSLVMLTRFNPNNFQPFFGSASGGYASNAIKAFPFAVYILFGPETMFAGSEEHVTGRRFWPKAMAVAMLIAMVCFILMEISLLGLLPTSKYTLCRGRLRDRRQVHPRPDRRFSGNAGRWRNLACRTQRLTRRRQACRRLSSSRIARRATRPFAAGSAGHWTAGLTGRASGRRAHEATPWSNLSRRPRIRKGTVPVGRALDLASRLWSYLLRWPNSGEVTDRILALRIVPAQFFRPVLLEPLIAQVVDRGNANNARWTARRDLVDAMASQEALTSRDFRQERIDGLRHEKPTGRFTNSGCHSPTSGRRRAIDGQIPPRSNSRLRRNRVRGAR